RASPSTTPPTASSSAAASPTASGAPSARSRWARFVVPDRGAMIDRSKIEALVKAALGEAARGAGARPVDSGGGVMLRPDRGANLAEPFEPQAMRAMLEATPARIAVGRAGTRYRTNTQLRFRADHAAAKDAVLSEVDEALAAKLGLVQLTTRATIKVHFLQRPDAGRALSDESRTVVAEKLPRG